MRRSQLPLIVLGFWWIAVFVWALFDMVDRAEARAQRIGRVNDAIVSCLQKEGMPIYGVGPAGVPERGQALTAEHVSIICVEEKSSCIGNTTW